MGGTSGLCIATDCQQAFFLCSPTLFLPVPFGRSLSLHLVCHTHCSVVPERTCNHPLPTFFGTRGLTTCRDQISQFAMETTQRGTSNYCREAADAREKDKKGNSKLSTTERLFQLQSMPTQVWMRFLVWQVWEFEGPRRGCKCFITAEEQHWVGRRETQLCWPLMQLDLWEEPLKWKLHGEKDGASEGERF